MHGIICAFAPTPRNSSVVRTSISMQNYCFCWLQDCSRSIPCHPSSHQLSFSQVLMEIVSQTSISSLGTSKYFNKSFSVSFARINDDCMYHYGEDVFIIHLFREEGCVPGWVAERAFSRSSNALCYP